MGAVVEEQPFIRLQTGIILKWNYDPAIDSTIVRIASIISSDNKDWILYDPSHPVTRAQVESELIAGGVDPLNLIMMEGNVSGGRDIVRRKPLGAGHIIGGHHSIRPVTVVLIVIERIGIGEGMDADRG